MKIHRDVIANATDEQLKALRDNVLKDKWEHIPDDEITCWMEFGRTLMVQMGQIMVLGIETDGYTHS